MKKKKKTQKIINPKNGKQNSSRKPKKLNQLKKKLDKKSATKKELKITGGKKKEKERSKKILGKKKEKMLKKKKKKKKQKKPKGTSEDLVKYADLLENTREKFPNDNQEKNDVLSFLIENETNIRELVKILFLFNFISYSSTAIYKKLRNTILIFYRGTHETAE